MPNASYRKLYIETIANKFNEFNYCLITGQSTVLSEQILEELKNPYSKEYGLLLKQSYKDEIGKFLFDNYDITNNELKSFPALYLVGLILYKFGYINKQLFSILVSFLKAQDFESKQKFLKEYCNIVMFYKLYSLPNRNDYKVILVEDKDSERDNIVITNNIVSYSFKNLNNASKVCDLILEEELGVF